MSDSNHYDTLDVSPKATPAEIKQAYRRLAKLFHPDSKRETADPEKIIRLMPHTKYSVTLTAVALTTNSCAPRSLNPIAGTGNSERLTPNNTTSVIGTLHKMPMPSSAIGCSRSMGLSTA
jgi:hypothetical protein